MKYCIALVLAALFLFGCADEKVKPKVDYNLKAEKLPTQESWKSTVIFTDSGFTAAILNAGHLRMYAETQQTLLDEGVKVDFYNTDRAITTTLTSKTGRVEDVTRNLFAFENVIVKGADGTVLKTEELEWRNIDKKIVTDKFVTIVTPKEKIQGYGFESDQHLKNYVIRNITIVTQSTIEE
jgi:LPS export ABC transporter protein LptC